MTPLSVWGRWRCIFLDNGEHSVPPTGVWPMPMLSVVSLAVESPSPPPPGQGAGGPGRAWVRAPGHQAREAPPTRPARPASPGPWVEGAVLCVTPQQGREMPSWGPGAGSAPPTPVYPLEGGLGRASNAPAPGGGESWNPLPSWVLPPPGSPPGSPRCALWRDV